MTAKARAAKNAAPAQAEIQELDPMNAYALRVWENQSVSLSLRERVQRIKSALIEQGFEDKLDTLELPTKEDFKRFL